MMMHDDSAIVEQNLAPRAIFLKDTARGAEAALFSMSFFR